MIESWQHPAPPAECAVCPGTYTGIVATKYSTIGWKSCHLQVNFTRQLPAFPPHRKFTRRWPPRADYRHRFCASFPPPKAPKTLVPSHLCWNTNFLVSIELLLLHHHLRLPLLGLQLYLIVALDDHFHSAHHFPHSRPFFGSGLVPYFDRLYENSFDGRYSCSLGYSFIAVARCIEGCRRPRLSCLCQPSPIVLSALLSAVLDRFFSNSVSIDFHRLKNA